MFDDPPAPPPVLPQAAVRADQPAASLADPQADGRVVIDLTQFVPAPRPEECIDTAPDPLYTGIVVCKSAGPSPRLGPMVGPVDDAAFGSAIPRARIRLSDKAAAEANVHNTPVGGFNANGGEVRLKIDF